MKPYPGHVLRRGSTGPAVRAVQAQLATSTSTASTARRPSGRPRFQARHKPALQADGEVGPITWAALFGQPIPEAGAKTPRGARVRERGEPPRRHGGRRQQHRPDGHAHHQGQRRHGPGAVVRRLRAYCYRLAGSTSSRAEAAVGVRAVDHRTAVKVTTSPARGISSATTGTTTASTTTSSCSTGGSSPARRSRTIGGNTGKDPNVSDSTAGGDGVHRRVRSMHLVHDFLKVTR
jgi:peptidoglycan hydrolase-like protein with peptidoglycan-binding domain